MDLRLIPLHLPLAHPFRIARGEISVQESLIVKLSAGGVQGYGEVTCDRYYQHTFASMSRSLERVRPLLAERMWSRPEELWEAAARIIPDDPFALSALDAAAYDLIGKQQGRSAFELLDLDWKSPVDSSYTIGIAPIPKMIAKLKEQPGWSVYKIKLGAEDDLAIVRALRSETNATLRVDANCAWSAEQAIEYSHALAELGVEFIEQPLPAQTDPADHRRVYEQSALPIMADESCCAPADVARCAGLFHGVNVKLCKCGGLTPAARMLREARSLGLRTMLGCMVESSIGISAAAQLTPMLDYADLDGAVLLKTDPATGVKIERGRITLPELPGCGCGLIPELVEQMQVRE